MRLVPSGEVRDPRRTVPRAIYLALGLTTVLYLAIQAVAQGVLGAEMAQHTQAPLAAASSRFLGEGGRLLVLAGGAALAAALAISSSFRYLALLANVAVLALYFLCCAAALRLVSRSAPDGEAAFTFPGDRVVPVAAMAVIAWILAHATGQELAVLGVTLVVAAALYGVRRLARA